MNDRKIEQPNDPDDNFWDDEPEESDDDWDVVGWECVGCMLGPFDGPGHCPVCDNELTPYG